jgi:hypothetical protein
LCAAQHVKGRLARRRTHCARTDRQSVDAPSLRPRQLSWSS